MPLAPYTYRRPSTAAIDWSSIRWYKPEDRMKLNENCIRSKVVVFDLTFWCPTQSNNYFEHACCCIESLRTNSFLKELHILFPRDYQSNSSTYQETLYSKNLKAVAIKLAHLIKNHDSLAKVTAYNLHSKSTDNTSTPGLMNLLSTLPIVQHSPFDGAYKAIQSYDPFAWEEEDAE